MILFERFLTLLSKEKFLQYATIIIGAGITIIFALLVLYNNRIIELADLKYYDAVVTLYPDKAKNDSVVIVDIDDISLQKVGQWPWSRYKMAELLIRLSSKRVSAVGHDIIFAESDRTSLKNIKEAMKSEFDIDLNIDNVPEALKDNDKLFAEVIRNGPYTISNYFLFDSNYYNEDYSASLLKVNNANLLPNLYEAKGMLSNLPQISSPEKAEGFFNISTDSDGLIRRIPSLIKYKNDYYPNISMATFINMYGYTEINVEKDFNGAFINFWGRRIPIQKDGNVLLNYREGAKRFTYVPAINVLNGTVPDEVLKGKIVFIGSSAAGLNDIRNTPVERNYPGVEIHATFVDNLINNDFFMIPQWSKGAQIVSLVVIGLMISAVMAFSSSLMSAAVVGLTTLIVLIGGVILLLTTKMYVSPVPNIINATAIWLTLSFIRYFAEEKRALSWATQVSKAQEATMFSMAAVAETRDPETGEHIFRTQTYVKLLAEKMVERGLYRKILTPEYINLLFKSAPLHDIGKVGVPDRILLKPGKLTDEEFEIMKTHSQIGADMILKTEEGMIDKTFLECAREIALSHHEKWDGTGYPNGLKGDEIPLSGRLMAVADVYDALISKRHYKEKFSYEKTREIIIEGRGKHFDPDIVDAFIEVEKDFIKTAELYK